MMKTSIQSIIIKNKIKYRKINKENTKEKIANFHTKSNSDSKKIIYNKIKNFFKK